MNYLKQLIIGDENTEILDLEDTLNISDDDKIKILGPSITNCVFRVENFIESMYVSPNSSDRNWYYFKENKSDYPINLLDEFMGSYLAKKMGMRAVDYSVAHVGNKIGIASQNFKEDGFDYHFVDYYRQEYFKKYGDTPTFGIDNVEELKMLCKNPSNEEDFINHILEMFALDVYTLKSGRNYSDIQFQVNKKTGDIDLAPLYSFSNCLNDIDDKDEEIALRNSLVTLDNYNISYIINKYPYFLECLSTLMEHGMGTAWKNICIDNHFNQECEAYTQVLRHYEKKEENQKVRLKKLIDKAPSYHD